MAEFGHIVALVGERLFLAEHADLLSGSGLTIAFRFALVMLVGLGLVNLLKRQSASLRHTVLAWSLGAGLAIPLLSLLAPSIPLPVVPDYYRPQQLVNGVGLGATPRAGELVYALSRNGIDRSLERPIADSRTGDPESRSATYVLSLSVILLWGAGVCFLGARLLAGILLTGQIRARSRPLARSRLVRMGAEAITEAGVNRPVPILVGPVDLPAVLGILRSVVVLPIEAVDWPDDRFRCVVSHELAHVKRRDSVVQVLSAVVCAFYWFNPLVWVLAARLRLEREQACDDLILRQGVRSSTYAEHLLAIARSIRVTNAVGVAMAHPTQIERRLLTILSPNTRRDPASRSTNVLVASVAVLTLTLAAVVEPWAEPETDSMLPSWVFTAKATQLLPQGVRMSWPSFPTAPGLEESGPASHSPAVLTDIRNADEEDGPVSSGVLPVLRDSIVSLGGGPVGWMGRDTRRGFRLTADGFAMQRKIEAPQERTGRQKSGRFGFGLGGEWVQPRGSMTKTSRGLRVRGALRVEDGTSLEMTVGYAPLRVVATVDQIDGFGSGTQTVYDTQGQLTVGMGLRRVRDPEAIRSLYWSFAGGVASVPGTALVKSTERATPVALESKWGYFVQPRVGLVFVARQMPSLAMDVSAGMDIISWGSYSAIQQTFTFGLNYTL